MGDAFSPFPIIFYPFYQKGSRQENRSLVELYKRVIRSSLRLGRIRNL